MQRRCSKADGQAPAKASRDSDGSQGLKKGICCLVRNFEQNDRVTAYRGSRRHSRIHKTQATQPTLPTLIAVSDRIPAYRNGLCRALDEVGFEALEVIDPRAWAKDEGRRGLLFTVGSPEDSVFISELRSLNAELVIVALLREFNLRTVHEAIQAGADGAVAWEATPARIIAVLQAALDGDCLLPAEIGRVLACSVTTATIDHISRVEARWLQMLANGATVADVARDASYSEREMFRLLNRLYRAMGARNRVEAIVMAARAGLLGGEDVLDDKTP